MTDVAVEVVESERVAPRGRRTRYWLVRRAEAWVRVHEWPGAASTDLQAGPGTIWERQTALRLPLGTLLLRVDSAPAASPRREPLDYLAREPAGVARAVQRSTFRVGREGRLSRVQPAPRPG